jgi:hypothetical protein
MLKRMPRPLSLDFMEDFIYDAGEGRFYGVSGPMSGREILDYVYGFHCRTLLLPFRIRWAVRSAIEKAIRYAGWSLHDAC